MSKLCTGSYYGSDWSVYTREDAIACENAGGRVIETGGDGCGATTVASFVVSSDNPSRGAVAELALSPLRDIRQKFGEHELLQALLELNRVAAGEIGRIATEDDCLRADMVEAFTILSALAAAVSQADPPKGKLETATLDRLENLGRRIVERSSDQGLRQGIERVLDLARPFCGKSLAKIAKTLRGDPEKDSVRESVLPSRAIIALAARQHMFQVSDTLRSITQPTVVAFIRQTKAEKAFAEKAKSLGWVGPSFGDVEAVSGGFRQQFENADILVGDSGIPYEVHGDIRAKYNLLGGPTSPLGLPVTDETGTPDGVGRFNHFVNQGSIYWTPTTGPMMVQGRVREEWAGQGWERGPMGYPVRDQQRMPALYPPADHPNLAWCLFQNGALFSVAGAGATALAAEIAPEQLRAMVRSFFDQRLKQANNDLGLEAQVESSLASEWSYGFWAAVPRMLTFGLHGFHDNGFLPDSTFDLQIRLRFSTAWPMQFTYPSSMSLVVALDWVRVHASGLGSGDLASGLRDGIVGAFYRGGPDPRHPEVPDGAVFLTSFLTGASQRENGNLDVIDILTTTNGGLQILLNPLPPIVGGLRRMLAQQAVDAFLEV